MKHMAVIESESCLTSWKPLYLDQMKPQFSKIPSSQQEQILQHAFDRLTTEEDGLTLSGG